MKKIIIKVYAKINLALDILGVYPDKYHKLDMLMASIDIFDVICVSKAKESRVVMDGKVCDETNTASKAAKLLADCFGIALDIDIKKGIPMSAGLGGSSADASGVFVGAQVLFDLPMEKIVQLASNVGSDVLYMMNGGNCRVSGKGEIVQNIFLPKLSLVVAQKEVGQSTSNIYAKYDKNKTKIRTIDEAYESIVKEQCGFFNVLQPSAIDFCPSIEQMLAELGKYTERTFMTGSGSAVVGVFDDMFQAEQCVKKLQNCCFAKAMQTKDSGIEIIF